MIGIIDYGLGNVSAFENIYRTNLITSKRIKSVDDFKDVTHIILPGVGAFDKAMTLLKESNLIDNLNHLVLKEKLPILGICVGMQIMANSSDEGELNGLGWIPGKVKNLTNLFLKIKPMCHIWAGMM